MKERGPSITLSLTTNDQPRKDSTMIPVTIVLPKVIEGTMISVITAMLSERPTIIPSEKQMCMMSEKEAAICMGIILVSMMVSDQCTTITITRKLWKVDSISGVITTMLIPITQDTNPDINLDSIPDNSPDNKLDTNPDMNLAINPGLQCKIIHKKKEATPGISTKKTGNTCRYFNYLL